MYKIDLHAFMSKVAADDFLEQIHLKLQLVTLWDASAAGNGLYMQLYGKDSRGRCLTGISM